MYHLHPTTSSNIFIVDDESTSRNILANICQNIHEKINVQCFVNASDALSEIEYLKPDMVLTDFKMPDINGSQFITKLRSNIHCTDIPIIAITIIDDKDTLYQALEAGATDFLVKPIDSYECMIRCRNLLLMQKRYKLTSNHVSVLKTKIENANKDIISRELDTLSRLERAGEYKGSITGKNLYRMGRFTNIIAEELGFNEEDRSLLSKSASIHDIGKIGIPDSILMKNGPLSEMEFNIIKTHTHMGYNILKDSPSRFLGIAATIALQHHEKYDGSGYPMNLVEEEIAIEARIATVADVFDALISERPYKKAWRIEDAYKYIEEYSGSHFDPQCVAAFFSQKQKINRVLE